MIAGQKYSASIQKLETIRTTASYGSWVEINTQAIAHNLAAYKSIAPLSLLAPVIKSNAYGHGIDIVAKVCQDSPVVDMICVVSVSEALHVRALGFAKQIIVLSIMDNDLEQAILKDIQLVVYDVQMAHHLNALAGVLGKRAVVHIKVDTGLSRLGFLWDTAVANIKTIHSLPFIRIQGIFSHLAESENTDQTFTNLQFERFNWVLAQCEQNSIQIPLVHTSCSAAVTGNSKSHLPLIRLGIGVYGLWPSPENKIITQATYPEFSLHSALTWKTKIIQLKQVPSGSYIGYDRTHQVMRDTLIATLPVGYWDGYDRGLSNKSAVLIHGQPVPVLGRIAMNLMMVDATTLNVQVGDEATLLGDHEAITAEALAKNADTINYELVTRINPLLPRVVV